MGEYVIDITKAVVSSLLAIAFWKRFMKPPLAKCRCAECRYHTPGGRCSLHFAGVVVDDFFCRAATPRKKGE